jgi:membrane protein YqaA with SNARE-associated domain
MGEISELGYLGLFVATLLASTVIPFSSDALYIAFLAFGHKILPSLALATAGNWIGSLTTYWIGRAGNRERIEKWFHVSLKKLESKRPVIDKYGSWLALLVWLPFIGDVFAVALGFYKIDFRKTASFMLLGKFLRFSLLSAIYYFFIKGFTN